MVVQTIPLTPIESIMELNVDELDEVGGGLVWLVPVVIAVLGTALISEIAHHHT